MPGAWTSGANGAALSAMAFGQGIPGLGGVVVTFGLIIFAFSTILGWAVYGERCAEYIFGVRVISPYRVLWVAAVLVGALLTEELDLLWLIADVMNGFMAIPNLIAPLLSPVIFSVIRAYFAEGGAGTAQA